MSDVPRPLKRPYTKDGVYPEGVEELASLSSRSSFPLRRDIFWSGDWIDRGYPVAWRSLSDLKREAEVFHAEVRWPNGRKVEEKHSLDALASHILEDERLLVLAALDQWRTLTNEQIASLTGIPLITLTSKVMPQLCDTRLADYGVSVAESSRPAHIKAPHLPIYRPGEPRIFNRLIRPRLTYAQYVVVTGGIDFSADRQFDRHNMLAAEFGLRCAEYLPDVCAVVGEKLSMAHMLFPALPPSQMGADLTLIRSDGLRIAVELTASVSTNFRAKVDRWARILDRFPDSGVVVVFVEASKPRDVQQKSGTVMSQIIKQVSMAAGAYPGLEGSAVKDRMFVTSYSQLFPAPHVVNVEKFFTFVASSPSRSLTVAADKWERHALMDTTDVPLLSDVPVAIDQVNALAASPFFFRHHQGIGVWNQMLDAMGVDFIPMREAKTITRFADGSWGEPFFPSDPGQRAGATSGETDVKPASRGVIRTKRDHMRDKTSGFA